MEMASLDLHFGVTVSQETGAVMPTVVLEVVAFGHDVRDYEDQPLEMLALLMEQIAEKHAEGLINPVKVEDNREQADGTSE